MIGWHHFFWAHGQTTQGREYTAEQRPHLTGSKKEREEKTEAQDTVSFKGTD